MRLFTLVALVAVCFAASVPKRSFIHSRCSDAKLVIESNVKVGDNHLRYTSHFCGPSPKPGFHHGIFDYPPLCKFCGTCKKKKPPPRPTSPANVCGVNCTASCNNKAGILPPISDDCQTIEDAIQIFQGQQESTFVVDPNHLETLTFGTCNYFFQNNGSKQLESCWSDLSIDGSAAGSACFPPVQPFFSEGLCSSSDGTWSIGAAHS